VTRQFLGLTYAVVACAIVVQGTMFGPLLRWLSRELIGSVRGAR
jgi:hypothetical protein